MSRTLELNDFEKSLPHHEMIFVEGGEFMMGNTGEGVHDNEQPVHRVQVSPFYMAKFPVTQAVWKAVMNGRNPSHFKGDDRPVDNVFWEDAQSFIQELSQKAGRGYRLPSEAEWEYAARGGKCSEDYLYGGSDKLSEVGWYDGNSGNETHAVGQLLPNELGLYDLSGNVYEWCEDDWHDDYQGAPTDGSAWINSLHWNRSTHHVLRGGSWYREAWKCQVYYRSNPLPDYRYDHIGFRLVFSPSQLVGH